MWRMLKNMTACARSAVMLDGEMSNYVDVFQGSRTGMCTLLPKTIQGKFQYHDSSNLIGEPGSRGGGG